MKNFTYNDIIHLPHHVSSMHLPLSMHNRAAQFIPFAALSGYNDLVIEEERMTEEKREMDEQLLSTMSSKISFLANNLEQNPDIFIEYFIPDQQKSGGSYCTFCGKIIKILSLEQSIILENNVIIPLNNIVALKGKIFESLE